MAVGVTPAGKLVWTGVELLAGSRPVSELAIGVVPTRVDVAVGPEGEAEVQPGRHRGGTDSTGINRHRARLVVAVPSPSWPYWLNPHDRPPRWCSP